MYFIMSLGWSVVQDTGADPVNVVCRICEETVPANQLDGHTKHCQSVHQLDNKTATTDVRLRKIVEALRQRREQSLVQQVRARCGCPMMMFWPGRMANGNVAPWRSSHP
jgi:hypothetical protein